MLRKPPIISNSRKHPGDNAPLNLKESEYHKIRIIKHHGGRRDTEDLQSAVKMTANALESSIKSEIKDLKKGYANPCKKCVSMKKKRFEMDGFD